jgi:hypothetical protein
MLCAFVDWVVGREPKLFARRWTFFCYAIGTYSYEGLNYAADLQYLFIKLSSSSMDCISYFLHALIYSYFTCQPPQKNKTALSLCLRDLQTPTVREGTKDMIQAGSSSRSEPCTSQGRKGRHGGNVNRKQVWSSVSKLRCGAVCTNSSPSLFSDSLGR